MQALAPLIIRSITRRSRRSLLTIGGVAISICVLSLLLAVAADALFSVGQRYLAPWDRQSRGRSPSPGLTDEPAAGATLAATPAFGPAAKSDSAANSSHEEDADRA